MRLHEHYDKLTERERAFVNDKMGDIIAEAFSIPLAGDDRCERFADAFARWIIESNPDSYDRVPPARTCPGHDASTDCEIDPLNPCDACNEVEDARTAG